MVINFHPFQRPKEFEVVAEKWDYTMYLDLGSPFGLAIGVQDRIVDA